MMGRGRQVGPSLGQNKCALHSHWILQPTNYRTFSMTQIWRDALRCFSWYLNRLVLELNWWKQPNLLLPDRHRTRLWSCLIPLIDQEALPERTHLIPSLFTLEPVGSGFRADSTLGSEEKYPESRAHSSLEFALKTDLWFTHVHVLIGLTGSASLTTRAGIDDLFWASGSVFQCINVSVSKFSSIRG